MRWTDLLLHIVRPRWVVIRRPRQQRSHTNFLNFLISGKNTVFFPFRKGLNERLSITYRSILNWRSWRWEVELTDYNSCRTMQKDRKWRSNQAVLSMPIPRMAGIPITWHDEWLDKESGRCKWHCVTVTTGGRYPCLRYVSQSVRHKSTLQQHNKFYSSVH